jgi:transcriptional regulator with XRE-family HTH domain
MGRIYQPRTQLHMLLDNVRLSQKMFAELMGVDPPTVSAWMSGKRIPQQGAIARMTGVLQVDKPYLEGLFIAQNLACNHGADVCKWIARHMTTILEEEKQDA